MIIVNFPGGQSRQSPTQFPRRKNKKLQPTTTATTANVTSDNNVSDDDPDRCNLPMVSHVRTSWPNSFDTCSVLRCNALQESCVNDSVMIRANSMPINYAKLLRAVQTNAYKCHLMLTGHLNKLRIIQEICTGSSESEF